MENLRAVFLITMTMYRKMFCQAQSGTLYFVMWNSYTTDPLSVYGMEKQNRFFIKEGMCKKMDD